MTEKIGLIKETIRLVKKDDELVDRILKARELSKTTGEAIAEILRYNIWTMNQFSDLTGFAISTISNLCRPAYKNGELISDLDFCYPFMNIETMGPKFIVRNKKSEAFLP